jgi:hypothetical protein
MLSVPYEFERVLYTRLLHHILVLSLLFILSGTLLLLPLLLPTPGWLDRAARLVVMVPFGWIWIEYAIAERIPTAILTFGLLTFLVPLEPFLRRRGISPFRWWLTLTELLFGLTLVLWPGSFPPSVYGLGPRGLVLLGTAMLLGGLGLAGTMRRTRAPRARAAAEGVAGVLLLLLSGLLATNQRWLGAETYGVMGCFGLLLPVLPRLRVRIRTRLAQRLIRAFTLAVLPPLLVMGGVTNAVMQRALRGQVFAGNAALTSGSAAFVRQYVQDG